MITPFHAFEMTSYAPTCRCTWNTSKLYMTIPCSPPWNFLLNQNSVYSLELEILQVNGQCNWHLNTEVICASSLFRKHSLWFSRHFTMNRINKAAHHPQVNCTPKDAQCISIHVYLSFILIFFDLQQLKKISWKKTNLWLQGCRALEQRKEHLVKYEIHALCVKRPSAIVAVEVCTPRLSQCPDLRGKQQLRRW